MALPKIKTVSYVVNLPKSGKVEYRPFLVKEEGAILNAIEFGKKEDLISTFKSIVQGCISTNIDINDMLMIEFIYMIILLRTKSKTSKLELTTHCTSCEKKFNFIIDLDEKDFFTNKENIKLLVDVKDDLAVELESIMTKDLDLYYNLENAENKIDATLDMFSHIITKVIYEKKPYIDFTPEEVKENILSGLSSSEFEFIADKMKHMISFRMTHDVECPHCNYKETRVYDEPLSFLV